MGSIAGIKSVAAAVNPTSRGATQPRARADATPPQPLVASSSSSGAPELLLFSRRPQAAFLAHLIATAQDAPQTRRHRRAAVTQALSAYAATAALFAAGTARRASSRAA